MKPWFKSLNKLARLAVITALLPCISGCDHHESETWQCYDTSGKPAGNVLIICDYGLPSYDKFGVTYRFSDASGKIILDLDKDTPQGLNRGYACVYSRDLKNGVSGQGERWHDGESLPTGPVYFDEWNNKIFIQPAAESDASARHAAVETLIAKYSSYRTFPNGGAKLDKELRPFVTKERDEFLAKYGEELVPPAYYKSGKFRNFHDGLPAVPVDNLKFKDITLDLPPP